MQSQRAGCPSRSKDFKPGQGFDSIVVEMASFAAFYLQWLKAGHSRAPTEVLVAGAPQYPSEAFQMLPDVFSAWTTLLNV